MDLPDLSQINYVYCQDKKFCPVLSCNMTNCVYLKQTEDPTQEKIKLEVVDSRFFSNLTDSSFNSTGATVSSSDGVPIETKGVQNKVLAICIVSIFTSLTNLH